MNAGKIALGAAIGTAAGVLVGVLFAPDKGTITRKKIMTQRNKYMGSFKKTANQYADNIEEAYDTVRETASDIAGKVNGAVTVLSGNGGHKTARRG